MSAGTHFESGPLAARSCLAALVMALGACGWTSSPAPQGLSYAVNPAVYAVGVAITPNAPTSTGGPVLSYEVDPALPAGLVLDRRTGVVSGTPTAVAAEATYTVRAVNEGGSATAGLVLTVNATVAPPAGLAYATNPAVYTAGQPIPPNTPSSTGGAVAAYAVNPDLPSGLSLDPATGVISGTPAAVTAAAAFTVTAQNAAGATSVRLTIAVEAAVVPPSAVSYATNPAVYATGVPIPAESARVSGGAATGFSVTPALPAGLSLNTATGAISGTPTAATAQATYTVTASNSAGSASVGLVITVLAKPGGLGYGTVPAAFAVGTAITPLTPTLSAGTGPFTYTVQPTLPAGLTLNATTGAIAGTPSTATAQAVYTVTASNAVGGSSANLTLAVLARPASLVYPVNPATYTAGVAVSNAPTLAGTGPFNWTVNPTLPAGLTFNATTGAISGTPTTPTASATYAIAASNAVGVATVVLTITVNAAVVAPSGLVYPTNPAIYVVGTAITANAPTLAAGSAPFTFSVTPGLPAGLSFSTSTGAVTGTPSSVTAQATHTVTATNAAGWTSVGLVITVNPAPPSGMAYAANPVGFSVNVPITNDTLTFVSGTPPFTFGVNPPLPAGLTLTATGDLTGTPTVATPQATYVVTATNAAGSATVGLVITVN